MQPPESVRSCGVQPWARKLTDDQITSAIQEFLVVVEARCHDVHADYHLVTSDQDYEEILRDFLTNRLPKKGKR